MRKLRAAELRRFVLDASVAAKWHLEDEDYCQQALAILLDYLQGKIPILAPDNIRYEVSGLIRKAVGLRILSM